MGMTQPFSEEMYQMAKCRELFKFGACQTLIESKTLITYSSSFEMIRRFGHCAWRSLKSPLRLWTEV